MPLKFSGRGYVGNPAATADTITPDGWLRTGDVAVVSPEGFITIVDRRKELIKYKGFQGQSLYSCGLRLQSRLTFHSVAPAELESILSDHPQIADSAVLGIFQDGTELPR